MAGFIVSSTPAWFDELIDEADGIQNNSYMMQDGFKKDSANLDGNPNHVGAGVPEGGQFTFAAGSKGALTKEAASARFPNETWEKKAKGVYVAESRKPKNKNQKEIFDKEFKAAKIAAEHGHIVFLLPEKGDGKHPDAIMDGIVTEFKVLSGGRNAISDNLRKGLRQGKNVYIKTNTSISIQEAKSAIHGRLKGKTYLKGKLFYYNETEKVFYEWNMQDFV